MTVTIQKTINPGDGGFLYKIHHTYAHDSLEAMNCAITVHWLIQNLGPKEDDQWEIFTNKLKSYATIYLYSEEVAVAYKLAFG